MKSETKKRALLAFDIESNSILATRDAFDAEAFSEAVEILSAAPRIGTTGCGHSGIACMHSGFLKEGDALVWASRGGKTDELFFILDICRTKKVTVIGVTENLSSPLAAKSHIVLPMKVTSETDRYNSQGTSSFIALAAVFDALQTAVIEETGYQNEQFALIHPGGAVGKRLNNRNI